MKKLILWSVLFLAIMIIMPTSADAERMFMSAQTAAIEVCDTLHHEQSCARFHVKKVKKIEDKAPNLPSSSISFANTSRISTEPGNEIELNGTPYQIEWAGEGYRLDSGLVVALDPQDSKSWLQIYPTIQPANVSDWNDADANNYLNAADLVVIDGTSHRVKETRFYLWVETTGN